MAVIITPQLRIDEYFASERLNQSKLKNVTKGLQYMLSHTEDSPELHYEEKAYFITGSAVDTILTGEEGEYEKQYFVTKVPKPGPKLLSIIHQVYDELHDNDIKIDLPLIEYKDMILAAIDEHEYQPKWKELTKLNKVLEHEEYFKELILQEGKQIITEEKDENIKAIVKSLRENFKTARYFDREELAKYENIDFYYQLPIYFTHEGFECKALMDLLVVFKDSKGRVLRVVGADLKTMYGNPLDFPKNVKSHRYDCQAVWYNLAVEHFIKNVLQQYQEVQIDPFTFVVESSSHPGKPCVYTLEEDILDIALNGRRGEYIGDSLVSYPIKGIRQFLDLYKFYVDNEWKIDYRERNIGVDGILKLGWGGIK